MNYRVKPSRKLMNSMRKNIWRRMLGGYIPANWKTGTRSVSAEELHQIMTIVYDARREGYSA